jgi:nitrogen regulatory protein PII
MGVTEYYRGVKEIGNLSRRTKLEIAVNDNFFKPAVQRALRAQKPQSLAMAKSLL